MYSQQPVHRAGDAEIPTADQLPKLMHRQDQQLQQLTAQNEMLRVSLLRIIRKIYINEKSAQGDANTTRFGEK